MTHKETARLIDKYREIAEKIILQFGDTSNPVTPNKYGAVQICDEGAFVECMIWIPKEEL